MTALKKIRKIKNNLSENSVVKFFLTTDIGEMPKNNVDEIVNKEVKEYLYKVKIIKLKYQIKIYKELV